MGDRPYMAIKPNQCKLRIISEIDDIVCWEHKLRNMKGMLNSTLMPMKYESEDGGPNWLSAVFSLALTVQDIYWMKKPTWHIE